MKIDPNDSAALWGLVKICVSKAGGHIVISRREALELMKFEFRVVVDQDDNLNIMLEERK